MDKDTIELVCRYSAAALFVLIGAILSNNNIIAVGLGLIAGIAIPFTHTTEIVKAIKNGKD